LLFATAGFSQKKPAHEPVIARAGSEFITEREFVDRFEMLPSLYRHRENKLQEAKLELLYSMIAEKLLAQEAESRGLDKDSMYALAMNRVRKDLARDVLYKKEISGKVSVSAKEIDVGILRALRQIRVNFLYAPRKEDLDFLRSEIRTAEDFQKLTIDSSMEVVRDTATIVFGDADPTIEDAAYALKKDSVSRVLKIWNGYYMMAVENERMNSTYLSMSPGDLRQKVVKLIRQRKEKARLHQFIKAFLKDKTGYSIPSAFKRLARALQKVFNEETPQHTIALNERMMQTLKTRLGSSLKDTLSVVGGAYWTIGEIIDRLYEHSFSIDSGGTREVPSRLNSQLEVWVQQELLAREAIRRGLDKSEDVEQQMQMWSDYYLSYFMKSYVNDWVTASDTEVAAYVKQLPMADSATMVKIRELRTRTVDEMKEAIDDIQNGAPFEAEVEKWSNDPVARQRKGESDFFAATDRYPIGEIAASLNVGQRYGPMQVEGGILYFELLAKKTVAAVRDTMVSKAKEQLLGRKRKNILDLFLAQSAKTRGFDIYADRLKALKVTSIPMMTYRILGFGGRMFGVPFVDRQLDWLGVEPPTEPIVP
jgi:parvulin-like peptidyl-prolyl isomerase